VHHVRAYPDVNGDGRDEVAIAVWNGPGAVKLLDGRTGTPHWTSGAVGTFALRVVPMSDVTGDGRPELAVASWADSAIVLSGQDGGLVWSTPAGGDVWAIDRIDDVTGDGLDEVAYGSFNGFAYLADGQTGAVLWEHPAGGHKVLRLLGAPDVDGDGRPEVVAGAQQLASAVEPLLFVLDADSGLAGSGPELRRGGSTALGGTVMIELSSAQPGHVAHLLLGPDAALVPLGAKGWLGLAAQTTTLLASFPVPPGGGVVLSGTVPNNPLLDGLVIHTQVIVLDPAPPVSGQSSNRVGMRFGE
jgi:hypothetical protein